MLRKFAAGLLATALIAGPAFAQTSNSNTKTTGSAPAATMPAAPTAQNTPVKGSGSSANVTAPANTAAPAATYAKQTAKPDKAVKHVKLHKKTRKHLASRSHVKSGKMHQARHVKSVKSHQAKLQTKTQIKAGAAAKRS
jgi:hypothetical protein